MSDRSEHEIRESIDATRARMGETIEQIGDRVNPERVKADLKAKAREQIQDARDNVKRKARNTMRDVEHGVTDTGRGIWATIKDNPVPAGLVGVGLAWLFANRRSGSHDVTRYGTYGTYSTGPAVPYRAAPVGTRYTEPVTGSPTQYDTSGRSEYGHDASPAGIRYGSGGATQFSGDGSRESEGLKEKAANVVHQATDRLSGAQERVGEWAHDQQERVGSLAYSARDRARNAERRVEERMQENPMAAGAMALAFGVAAGLMIPESEREHRMMGRSRDRVLERAQEAASTAGHKLHDSAREAAGESARKAVDEMWPQGDETERQNISEPRRF